MQAILSGESTFIEVLGYAHNREILDHGQTSLGVLVIRNSCATISEEVQLSVSHQVGCGTNKQFKEV
jgi:hypothetical protein